MLIGAFVFLLSILVSLFKATPQPDEIYYMNETMVMSELLKGGMWFGDAPVGLHGFLFKLPGALIILFTGPSVFVLLLVNAAIAGMTSALCYEIFRRLLNSSRWALALVLLTIFFRSFSLHLSTYMRDIPSTFAVLLLIYVFCHQKRKNWLVGLALLLLLDAKEYVLIFILPGLIFWLAISFFKDLYYHSKGEGTLSLFRRHIGLCVAMFLPSTIYVALMLFTSVVPLNSFLCPALLLSKGDFGANKFNVLALNERIRKASSSAQSFSGNLDAAISKNIGGDTLPETKSPALNVSPPSSPFMMKIKNMFFKTLANGFSILLLSAIVFFSILIVVMRRFLTKRLFLISTASMLILGVLTAFMLFIFVYRSIQKYQRMPYDKYIESVNASWHKTIDLRSIGFSKDAFSVKAFLPEFAGLAEDSNYLKQSPLVIFEDGKPLLLPKSSHNDIRTLGCGRYSHYGFYLYFSSSDNSEPLTNKRRYEIRMPYECVLFGKFTQAISICSIYLLKLLSPTTFSLNSIPILIVFPSVFMAFKMLLRGIPRRNASNDLFLSLILISFLLFFLVTSVNGRYLMPLAPVIFYFFIKMLRIYSIKKNYLIVLVLLVSLVFNIFETRFEYKIAGLKCLITCIMGGILLLCFLVPIFSKSHLRAVKLLRNVFITVTIFVFAIFSVADFYVHSLSKVIVFGYLKQFEAIVKEAKENEIIWTNSQCDEPISFYLLAFLRKECSTISEYIYELKDFVPKKEMIKKYNVPSFTKGATCYFDIPSLDEFLVSLHSRHVGSLYFMESLSDTEKFTLQEHLASISASKNFKLRKELRLKNKILHIFDVIILPELWKGRRNSIYARAKNGSLIENISAKFSDETTRFAFINPPTDLPFSLDPISGKLEIADADKLKTFDDQVLSLSISNKYGKSACEMEIVKHNGSAPKLTAPAKPCIVDENMPQGTPVCQLAVQDLDGDAVSDYRIVSGNEDGAFHIDPDSGLLSVSGKIDFEKCRHYELAIEFSDGINVSSGKVQIKIQDCNDNIPEVHPQTFTLAAEHFMQRNFAKVLAFDPDSSELSYKILNDSDEIPFSLDAKTGLLSQKRQFTESDPEKFVFYVRVADGKHAKTVPVNVIRRKETQSIATPSPQNYEINENAKQGEQISNLSNCINSNGKASFAFLHRDDKGVFDLSDEGILSVAKPWLLDSAVQKIYNLFIKVSCRGQEIVLPVTIALHVNAAPNLPSEINAKVNENSEGQIISEIFAEPPNIKNTNVSILNGNEDQLFVLKKKDGKTQLCLKEGRVLDYEKEQMRILTVAASNGSITSTCSVKIQILDANDNVPFVPTQNILVRKNKLEYPHAMDIAIPRLENIEPSDKIEYFIIGENKDILFEINKNSGMISCRDVALAECGREYSLLLRVSDGVRDSYGIMKIIFEKADIAAMAEVKIRVKENLKAGTEIYNCRARKNDSSGFEILSGNIENTFKINRATGIISVGGACPIDHEIVNKYDLLVAYNAKSGKEYIVCIIEVVNENDNPPEILHSEFELDTPPWKGDLVGVVTATDKDGGELIYRIASNDEEEIYSLDRKTGRLTFNGDEYQHYPRAQDSFKISVSDGVHETLSDCIVKYGMASCDGNMVLPYSVQNGHLVRKAQCPKDKKHTFSIVSGNDASAFKIDENTGEILVADRSRIDFSKDVIDLTVEESDGICTRHSTISLILRRLPSFSGDPIRLEIDPRMIDSGVNMGICKLDGETESEYEIISGNEDEFFCIDKKAGILKINKEKSSELLKSAVSEHVLALGVKGDESPSGKTITVGLRQNKEPEILNLPESIPITENTPDGTAVWRADILDPDNDNFRLKIIEVYGNSLSWDEKMCELKVSNQKMIDHERKAKFKVKLSLSDGFSDKQYEIPVLIENLNDNPPFALDRQRFQWPFVYNYRGFPVARIIASDADGEPISYSIVSGNEDGLFRVDARTGLLFLQKGGCQKNNEGALCGKMEILLRDGTFSRKIDVEINLCNPWDFKWTK